MANLKRPKKTAGIYSLSKSERAHLQQLNAMQKNLNDVMLQYLSAIAIEQWGFKEGDQVAFEKIDLDKGEVILKQP